MMTESKSFSLINVRLPSWLLPSDWPTINNEPSLATLKIEHNHFTALSVSTSSLADEPENKAPQGNHFNAMGRLALPAFVDAHTHLDKTFTRQRLGTLSPGLLGAIDAMKTDQALWDLDDLNARSHRALTQASNHGVRHVRSHVDWLTDTPPLAWHVLAEQAQRWHKILRLQRVALIPLPLLSDQAQVEKIAHIIKNSDDSIMGAFIHSSNFNAQSIHWLVQAAAKYQLDLDLHIDEELNPDAQGLACLLDALEATSFQGRIICGHVCAISQKEPTTALALLDRVAKQPITLVSLPATNLLLQDDITDRTPRQRGLTLVHEAKARGIPLLFASDNVQDAFCAFGHYDPVEALRLGVYSAHLNNAFDDWSQSICRADWLNQTKTQFNLIGQLADLTLFDSTIAVSWPNQEKRWLLRAGKWIEPELNQTSIDSNLPFYATTQTGISYD